MHLLCCCGFQHMCQVCARSCCTCLQFHCCEELRSFSCCCMKLHSPILCEELQSSMAVRNCTKELLPISIYQSPCMRCSLNLSCLSAVHLPAQITVATSMTLRVGSTAEQTFNAVERVQVGAAGCACSLVESARRLFVFLFWLSSRRCTCYGYLVQLTVC
jgi:hypothetical protein